MDIPLEVVEAVKQQPTAEPKKVIKRAPHKRNIQKRVLHAVINGLRTTEAIANALNLTTTAVGKALYKLGQKKEVYSLKKVGSNTLKYYSTIQTPVLGTTDLTKKKPRKPYTKRKSTYDDAGVNTTNSFNTPPKPTAEEQALKQDVDRLIQRISNLEVTLTEKEKEVWTLECEVFDKKAIIKYLEEKLFALGVRV
jgi:hypothetical protein